ncbi:MAG: TolC family protein, partial [Isosphaeraceae bacterium]|nr:TolC family protein [Isosphaeraceae bacterium]
PVIPSPPQQYPIDLSVALRLAEAENPTIAQARTQILQALALQQIARSLLLPTLNAGTNYHGHTGNLQRSSGRIFAVSEQSLYFGGGARTLAAETLAIPMINIASPITEAVYEPLAARQRLNSARLNTAATFNSVLRDVAVLYLDLLGAEAVLQAQRLSESQTAEVVRLTMEFAETGEGRYADANRADAEWKLRRAEVQKAEEEMAVASARLSQRLNLDPSVRLHTLAPGLAPIELIDPTATTEDLLQIALRRRPELGARAADISLAQYKLKEELARPWLPTFWLGFSGGAFGGGSNRTPPLLSDFKGRTDFDVRAFWTLLNFGAGNLALQNRRRAEIGQAIAARSRMINEVRREVASARAEALARRQQVEIARRKLTAADEGFHQDLELAHQGLNRPIEVLDNLNLLASARLELIRAITQYNQAEFRLFVALGSP